MPELNKIKLQGLIRIRGKSTDKPNGQDNIYYGIVLNEYRTDTTREL